ncbi:MAG: hypothetical protein ACOYBE_11655 [Blautia sp.]|jgi:hypothetical protein
MKIKNRQRFRKRLLRVFGAMVTMCLLLTSIGSHLIFAGSNSPTKGDLIPGSVTIDSPKALSGVALPGNSYGTVTWKNGSAVPSSYESSYGVVFKANSDCTADFSGVSGWDAASRTVSGTVTVYVKSLAPAKSEATETPKPETEPQETPEVTPAQTPEATEAPVEDDSNKEQITPTPDAGTPAEKPEDGESSFADEDKVDPEQGSDKDPSEEGKTPDVTPAPEKDSEDMVEKPLDKDGTTDTKDKDPADKDAADSEAADPETEDSVPEEEKALEEEPQPTPSEELPETPMDLVEETERPQSVSDDMSPEEQAAVAAANHTCQGITVSAEFLPWYVQFRVSDGSGFGFTNTDEASTFQAYEFQLWDLLNDTEYQIPAGETVQVTMPVIAGYEYSIQHILPDGSTETIIPNVYGDTLVFSTSSFSPFGIAGSKPLVGGDIAGSGYGTGSNSSSTTTPGSTSSSGSQNTTPTEKPSVNTGSNSNGSSSQKSGSNQNASSAKPAQTGDNTNVMPFVIIGLGALLVIAAVALSILGKKRNSSSKDSRSEKEK